MKSTRVDCTVHFISWLTIKGNFLTRLELNKSSENKEPMGKWSLRNCIQFFGRKFIRAGKSCRAFSTLGGGDSPGIFGTVSQGGRSRGCLKQAEGHWIWAKSTKLEGHLNGERCHCFCFVSVSLWSDKADVQCWFLRSILFSHFLFSLVSEK